MPGTQVDRLINDLSLASHCLRQDGTPASERALILVERALQQFSLPNADKLESYLKSPDSPIAEVWDELAKIDLQRNGANKRGVHTSIINALYHLEGKEKILTAQDLANAIPLLIERSSIGNGVKIEMLKAALQAFGVRV